MSRLTANLLLAFAALVWGSSFVVQQIGTGELGTMSFTGARFLIGAIVVSPFAFRQFKKNRLAGNVISGKDFARFILIGLVLYVAAALQQYGILHTTVSNSGFLTSLYVPLVPIIIFIFLKSKPHWTVWPASVGCVIGTYIMSGAHSVELAVGDIWVLASTIFWAIHVILVGKMAQKTGAPLVLAFCQFLVCAIFGLVVGGVIETPSLDHFWGAIQGVLYIGIFSVGIAFTLQVVAQRYTPAPDAVIILSLEAVFAALGGVIFLEEHLSGLQISGALLILVSILAVELLPVLNSKRQSC
ncbi:MAG: DMT family transporter [Desulfotalea sp.]